MATPQRYDQCLGAVDGQLLGEAESVEVSNENTSQDVMTLVKQDFAGETPGPDKTRITVSSFLPAAGAEFDFQKAEQAHSIHTFTVIQKSSGKKLTSEGVFRNVRVTSGVGQNTKMDCEFHGTKARFE